MGFCPCSLVWSPHCREQRGSVSADREAETQTLVACSKSHRADLLWGLRPGLWAGNWLGRGWRPTGGTATGIARCARAKVRAFMPLPGRLGVMGVLSLGFTEG